MNRRTGTRLVKTIKIAIARLRACPSETFCLFSVHSGVGVGGPATTCSVFSHICACLEGKWHGLGGCGVGWDMAVVG